MPVAAALLIVVAQGQFPRHSVAARVARLAGRASRPRRVVGWAAGTFVTYGLTGFVALILLGRTDAMLAIPVEFRMLGWSLGLPAALAPDLPVVLASLGGGVALGLLLLVVRARWRRGPSRLIYRHAATVQAPGETGPALLLSLAAGVGEELFFRLALPLSIAQAGAGAAAAMIVATAAFGLAHRYQGWVGIAGTTLVGAALAWLYLWTGALWLVMLLHALADVHALVLRPRLMRRPAGRG